MFIIEFYIFATVETVTSNLCSAVVRHGNNVKTTPSLLAPAEESQHFYKLHRKGVDMHMSCTVCVCECEGSTSTCFLKADSSPIYYTNTVS